MWIMKPSVQAMSEGEWPPPTTFTRLFCCLARASTCQDGSKGQVFFTPEVAREHAGVWLGLQGSGWACRGGGRWGARLKEFTHGFPVWLWAAVLVTPAKQARERARK